VIKPARIVVLDAMGVIYRARDDVAELLEPFVERQGSSSSASHVAALYAKASVGQLEADAFWRTLGLDPGVEDEYLAGHVLSDGLLAFLEFAHGAGIDVWCLSNDVSRWSFKLRRRFGLDQLFAGFVISGDIGHRKPGEEAYRCLVDRTGVVPDLFVDDRPCNVAAARSLGIPAACFGGPPGCDGVNDFAALTALLKT